MWDWYANPRVITLLLRTMPHDFPRAFATAPKGVGAQNLKHGPTAEFRPRIDTYDERGWPCFEVAAASLVKSPKLLLDVPAVAVTEKWEVLGELMENCQLPRSPPLLPSAFERKLKTKAFSDAHGARDLPIVCELYTRAFTRRLAVCTPLEYTGLRWSLEECATLCHLFASGLLTGINTIDLRGNHFRDREVWMIEKAVAHGVSKGTGFDPAYVHMKPQVPKDAPRMCTKHEVGTALFGGGKALMVARPTGSSSPPSSPTKSRR